MYRSYTSIGCYFCLTSIALSLRYLTLSCCWILVGAIPVSANPPATSEATDISEADPKAAAEQESILVANVRQLTFEGRRAGEGYFSRDGSQIVFQSEREPGNPFFQIYVMDLETGDIEQISPGNGKTTCAWIHPQGDKVLFASTHDDKSATQKQEEEIGLRKSGKERRYSWDYDEHFEIYQYERNTGEFTNLTHVRGYDAEGSWSPDGKLIAFASNRTAYLEKLTPEAEKQLGIDAAYFNEIYLMQADGSNVQRLTSTPGYDGGPFFSPDGQRLCWRRFTPDGVIAEIWSMNIDGSDKRQLTRLGATSWAPYYHPSGQYLIFTTNRHGFANFELYMIDVAGKSPPIRVSYTMGFDGLPVFTPDGQQLAWTSNRTSSKQSQIFRADWNHRRALELLGLNTTLPTTTAQVDHADSVDEEEARLAAKSVRDNASTAFSSKDIIRHVDYLCREELAGRMTGTRGEKLATAYVASYLDSLGLEPAGDDGTWYQRFEFTSGVALGDNNSLVSNDESFKIDQDWRPLSFSGTGHFEPTEVVFAGYGIKAPKDNENPEYDSYVHLDVKDKWVIVLRYMPENISNQGRQHLSRPSQLRFKATVARDQGARGLIVVSGPHSKAKSELLPLRLDGILAGSSLPVISVADQVVDNWLTANDKRLEELQTRLDTGEPVMGFELKEIQLAATIDVQRIKGSGRNVLGRLAAGDEPSSQIVVVGAHVDHLGLGTSSSSLARDNEAQQIHFGADDNASGVAAMLEIAEYLSAPVIRGKLNLQRDVIFAAWSGEELGLLGSDHFVKTFSPAHAHHHEHEPSHHHSIYPAVAACINMDMVGRLEKNLILQGVGSSSIWRGEIERRNIPVGLPITLQEDSYLPTDAKSFYTYGVPVLSAFTGSHSEYHTPRDTPDTLNFEGAAAVARLMSLVTRSIAMRPNPPDYQEQSDTQGATVGRLRAYLGTIPDYTEEVKGVLLSGARKNGPADKAGVQAGDIIVELAGKKIENIYDYTHAIEALKIGKQAKIVVLRKGERIPLEIIPGSRD